MTKLNHRRHRDFETFDEVRIRTVVRFKTSELSGDEYRTSAVVELLFKGCVIVTAGYPDVKTAGQCLGWLLSRNSSPIPKPVQAVEQHACDQPGCHETATHKFSLKKLYSQSGHELVETAHDYRQFCREHSRRGACGLEDADSNYSRMEQDEQ